MMDHVLLGEISSNSELEETLLDLDSQWYIGRETEAGWVEALGQCRGNLFSLGHNQSQVGHCINKCVFWDYNQLYLEY